MRPSWSCRAVAGPMLLTLSACPGPCHDLPRADLTKEDTGTTVTLRAVSYREFYEDDRPGIAVGDAGTVLVRGSQPRWEARASDTTADLRGLAFADGSNFVAVAVGAGGTIVRTVDGGERWKRVDSGTVNDLNAADFGSFSNGVAVGDGVVLRSEDQGRTWSPATIPDGTGKLWAVATQASTRALAVGDGGLALWSEDGGRTWMPVDLATGSDLRAVISVAFVDGFEDDFLIADGDGELHVLNEGLSGSRLPITDPSGFVGLAPGGWLLAADGSIDLLLDNGDSRVDADAAEVAGKAVALLAVSGDYSTGFIVGERGTIVRAEFASPNCVRYY